MSMFKNPNELEINSTVKLLVYGQPGIGKTTLALSSPNPVLFDFDGGISRVNKAHQCPTLQVKSWDEALAAIEELKKGEIQFKTIIVDTVGKMLDYMGDYIIKNNPKMKKADGALTQSGYMMRKNMFSKFIADVSMMGKHIVFVAHEKEERDDDVRIVRPDMGGSASALLIRELNLVGYMQANGQYRTVCWSPTEKYYAKNTCALPAWEKIPVVLDETGGVSGDNTYLVSVFDNYDAYLKRQDKIGEDYTALVDQIAADIAAITDADGANAFIAKIDDYSHIWDSKAKARRLFTEHMAKVENVTYDKKTKRYAAKG